jgi:hypothetical protein
MQKTDCGRPRFKCKAVRKLFLQTSVPICETTSATTRWLCGCGSCPSSTRGHIHERHIFENINILVDSSLFSWQVLSSYRRGGLRGVPIDIGLAFLHNRRWFLGTLKGSVADPDPNPDPDPPDPRVFGPPGSGSGSTSQRYGSGSGSCSGSGSGSFYHHAKIVRQTLIPTILWLFSNFYLWKMM